jgi:aryl-alcohol dehydrogenase-like predicted oxidoreductase
MSKRLALGTVQFGIPYGIANRAGQVSRDEAEAILHHAWSVGIDTIDTAISYGESEQRLGDIGVRQWKIVTKLPVIPESCTDVAGWVHESVQGSLARLGIPSLHGLLLHHSQQLLGPQGDALWSALSVLRDQRSVEKVGVSVYSPDELDAVWPRFRVDVVQAPFNILDRRLSSSGWLNRLSAAGTEIHVRSIFLQGLLLMDAADRSAKFDRWQPLWRRWHNWLVEEKLTPVQACLGFALAHSGITRVVVGVDSLSQLREILDCAGSTGVTPPDSLLSEELQLINPSSWNVLE